MGGETAGPIMIYDDTLEWLALCPLYTSDAADEEDSVDLGGRRIIKKKKNNKQQTTTTATRQTSHTQLRTPNIITHSP